jgi:hypothetical protein
MPAERRNHSFAENSGPGNTIPERVGESSMIGAGTAPAVKRVAPLNLADQLGQQATAVRNRHWTPVGHVMRIQLGISDDSAYFQDAVRDKIAPLTKLQGLTLDWNQQCYPYLAHMADGHTSRTEVFLFPRGIEYPPKIADPRYRRLSPTDPPVPMIRQDVDYYASGQIIGRDGTRYVVLQPVEQIAIVVMASMPILRGRTNPANGTKPALLYSPTKKIGFLVGGLLTFD